MIRFLLDTDTCITLIRGKGASILAMMRRHDVGDVGISSVTAAELYAGVFKSTAPERNRVALIEFMAPLEVLPFDADAAVHYGKLRADLESRGVPIGAMDMLIAAHAAAIGATVVTQNTREFRRVRNLKVENWNR